VTDGRKRRMKMSNIKQNADDINIVVMNMEDDGCLVVVYLSVVVVVVVVHV